MKTPKSPSVVLTRAQSAALAHATATLAALLPAAPAPTPAPVPPPAPAAPAAKVVRFIRRSSTPVAPTAAAGAAERETELRRLHNATTAYCRAVCKVVTPAQSLAILQLFNAEWEAVEAETLPGRRAA